MLVVRISLDTSLKYNKFSNVGKKIFRLTATMAFKFNLYDYICVSN